MSDGTWTNPVVVYELTLPVNEDNRDDVMAWCHGFGALETTIRAGVAFTIDRPQEIAVHWGDRVAHNDHSGFQAVPEWRMNEFQRLDLQERPDANNAA